MEQHAAKLIDGRIAEVGGWRGKMLAKLRAPILAADPNAIEEWRWSVPAWSHDGIICTGEVYKDKVKLTFAKGAQVDDPKTLFNSSLEGNTRRAIDFKEGDDVNEAAFKALVKKAAALNSATAKKKPAKKKSR